jgi:radical SAM protein (TIGR01212 family)
MGKQEISGSNIDYPWGHKRPFNDYSTYFKNKFTERVQKVAIDAGFTCPNRDGSKGRGGCTYCNNDTFNPFYCMPSKTITLQLNEGISFFEPKYKTQKYLCYFQAYSNTYSSFDKLKKIWMEALSHPKVIGLVIGTRPDCITEEILDFLADLSKKYYIVVEYGIESTLNRTLEITNRCHTFEESIHAIQLTAQRGIETGLHIILGLPGESRAEMIQHAITLSDLTFKMLKIHHLQIIKGTKMAKQYAQNAEMFDLFEVEDYIDLIVEFIAHLKPEIIIERFISESPPELLIAPKWNGLKNFEIVDKIEKRLINSGIWQGKSYINPLLK